MKTVDLTTNNRKRRRLAQTNPHEPKCHSTYVGRLNTYGCSNRHQTVTQDKHAGVTPMMIGCPHEGCEADAYSAGYNAPQSLTSTHYWVTLTAEELEHLPELMEHLATDEVDSEDLHEAYRDHISRGGLILVDADGKVSQ